MSINPKKSNLRADVNQPGLPLPKDGHNKIGLLNKFFKNIALFFTRIGLLFKYRVWYSKAKVEGLVKQISSSSDGQTNVYESGIEKVNAVLNKLTPYLRIEELNRLDLKEDELPRFNLLEKISYAGTRLLFQIHADEYGANNEELEGYTQKETLAYLSEYFTSRKLAKLDLYGLDKSFIKEVSLASEITKAESFEDFVQLIQEAFKNNPREKLLIPGGWVGKPVGHAMNYEVIPEEGNKVTFRIFNLGAGSEGVIDLTDYKTKAAPYIDFVGVERDKILNINFLQAIYEMNTYPMFPESLTKTGFCEDDIYKGLKELLEPIEVAMPDKSTFKTTQRSGVCSWRSLMAFLSSRMTRDEYKRFSCDIKMQSLMHRNWDEISGKVESALLEKAHKKIARKVGRLAEGKIVGIQYLYRSDELLSVAKTRLKKHKIELYKTPIATRTRSLDWAQKPIEKEYLISKNNPLYKQKLEVHNNQRSAIDDTLIESVTTLSLSKVISRSKQAIEERNFQVAHIAMQKYIMHLGVKDLKNEDIKKLSSELGKLSKLYFDTCFLVPEADIVHPERVIALKKMVHLQASIIENLNLQLDWHGSLFGTESPLEIFYNTNQGESKVNSLHGILNASFFRHLPIGKSSYVEFSKVYENEKLEILLPETHENLLKHRRGYAELPKFEQMANLFMSDETPLWFQNLRNTALSLHYLSHEPVANPVDGLTKSFPITLNLVREGNDIHVEFSIKEMTGDVLNEYPRLAKDRKKARSHFAPIYRPFKGQGMKGFIKYIDNKSVFFKEKRLLQDSVEGKKIKFSDEHFKELAHIFTQNNKYVPYNINKIAEGFEYFVRHPEKLADPDYQTLFEIFFFNGEWLKQELSDNKFPLKINQFLTEQLQRSITFNEVQKSVFLIRMSRLIHLYNPRVEDQTGELYKLIEREGLEDAEKSAIYAELVATLGKKSDLSDREVESLIIGVAYLTKNPVQKKWMMPQQNKEIREAQLIHHKKIVEALVGVRRNEILNRTAREIYGKSEKLIWECPNKGGNLRFKSNDGSMIFDVSTHMMFAENIDISLPLDILHHPHFVQNFKGVTSAKHGSNDVFTFVHKGCETLVKSEGGKVVIEQQRAGIWYRFIPRRAFVLPEDEPRATHLRSRHLLQNFSHWLPIEKPNTIHLIDLKTAKICYIAHLKENRVQKIEKIGGQYTLTPPTKLLTRFENPNYIQAWSENSKLVYMELPRFDLSFKREGKHWLCEQFQKEGFYIAKEQSVPVMGSYKSYLVLENAAGEKKILIPRYEIKAPKNMNAIKPDYQIDRNLAAENNAPQTYFTFDLEKSGLIENKSNSSKYYLSSLLTTVQEYGNAALYLRKYGSKLTRYTDDEVKSLKQIQKMGKITGDSSGDGVALQSYAMYLLLKNGLKNEGDISKVDLGKEIQIYKNYLAHLKNVVVLKLTREEEMFLLKTFLSRTFDPILLHRLSHLDPEFARTIEIPVEKAVRMDITSPSLLTLPLNELNHEGQFKIIPPLNKMLLTRINIYLNTNPFEMFQRIKNATPEQKKWFKDAFTFGKKTRGASFSFIFEDIMKYPEQYEIPPDLKDVKFGDRKSVAEKWWNKVKETAEKNTQQKRVQFLKKLEVKEIVTPLEYPGIIKDSRPEMQSVDLKLKPFTGFDVICREQFTKIKTSGQINKSQTNWLASETENPASKEPLYANEIARLKADAQHQKGEVHYAIKEIGKVETSLQELRNSNQNRLHELEVELIELANKSADSYREKIVEKLQVKGGSRKVLTINDLLISFARNDPESLVRMNPNISSDIEMIYDKVGSYLLLATHEQQRERGIKTFSKIKGGVGEEGKEYGHLLGAGLLTKRSYDPNIRPAYLVFEYYADLLMREQQVNKLQEFLENGDTNHVMEMIMGSGKSKVLLPLLGLLRADGKTISMVMVPQPLFEDVSSNTQRVLYDAFSQSLKALHFHRNTQFDRSSLQRIKDDLQEVIRKKECLIITSKSVQCLLLKFVEESHKQNGVLNDELVLMRDILNMLTESHPIIDEVDTVLNVLHEVSFSTGKEVKPKDEEIQLIAEMYRILYTDDEINSLIRIESNPASNKSGDVLTEINYHAKVERLLAEKTLKLSPFAIINEEDKNLAIDYFLHRNADDAQNYFNQQNQKLQNSLALAAEQISNFLPHTLTRTCEEKYGLDFKNGGSIAIPYAAANTPSEGSQFANPYITMNYTYQYYVKKGISGEIIIKEVERLQAMSMREMKEAGVGGVLENTEGWKLFKVLSEGLDIPLFNYNKNHIGLLTKKINSSIDWKLQFIRLLILPKLELYENKLSCNPQNLIAFFKQASGFTGTLWNQQSMHSKLKAMPDPGIDTKTLNILWKNSKDEVHIISETTPTGMINELAVSGIQYDLISDSGGYFKEGGNAEVARELSNSTGKPVVYYDKQNRQTIIDNGEVVLLAESSVPVDQRSTFLDQSHTTGSDTLQKRDAIGLVTISRKMLLRDLLQSVWRLRGLDKSQSVKFIISSEIHGIICQKLNRPKGSKILLGDILRFTIINQTEQQGVDNFKGLLQEMNSLPQQLLFKVMLSKKYTKEQRKATIDAVEKYWIKSSSQEPKDIFGALSVEEKNAKVIKAELEKFYVKIEELREKLPFFDEDLNGMKDKARFISDNLKCKLPTHILSPVRDIDDDQTVEVQQETEQETQVQLELHESDESESIELGLKEGYSPQKVDSINQDIFTDKLGGSIPYFDLKVYMETNDELREFTDCFEGVSLTLNVLQWPKKDPEIADLKLFGPHRTPFHQIQFNRDGEALIVSNTELVSYGSEDEYNLGFGFSDPEQKLTEQQQKQIVKIKFLNGESSYSKVEAKVLKKWIETEGAEKMFKLLQNHILAGMPDKISSYNNKSTLAKIFTKLRD